MVAGVLESSGNIQRLAVYRRADSKRRNFTGLNQLAVRDGQDDGNINSAEDVHFSSGRSLGGEMNHGIPSACAHILGNIDSSSYILRSAGFQLE